MAHFCRVTPDTQTQLNQGSKHMEIIIVMAVLFATICGYVASQKNRSTIGWAIAGALAGVFALIILAMVPAVKKTA